MSRPAFPLLVETVELPGGTTIDLHGFTVLVGPNSSGKTQLLRDIHAAACGQPRRLVVATSIKLAEPPTLDALLALAVASGGFVPRIDPRSGQPNAYRRQRHQLGSNEGAGSDIQLNELQQHHDTLTQSSPKTHNETLPPIPLLSILSGMSCAALFLENRLTLLQDSAMFDYAQSPPGNLVQSLYISRPARDLLEAELLRVFDRCIWPDYTRQLLVLLASDAEDAPPPALRIYPDEMIKHRPLSSEGDGLRSYAAVCTTLLLSQQPLCLIDEPELCLHPPQAYELGRFIGNHAQERPRGLIVATHSAHVLRGILDSQGAPAIMRLTRSRKHRFAPRGIDRRTALDTVQNPRARAESVLDGIFTECAVFCEAEGDRIVYEAAYSSLPTRGQEDTTSRHSRVTRDIRFIPVSGLSANTALLRMYRSLGIPAAAVADADLLTNTRELRSIAAACGADEAELQALDKLSQEIIAALRDTSPELSAQECKEILQELAAKQYSWLAGDDIRLRDKLQSLKNALGREKSIKSGLRVLEDVLRERAQATIDRLERLGLFILPVGVLESWIPDLMEGISKTNKAAWAAAAANKLRLSPPKFGQDVWAFVARIDRFARIRSEELAQSNIEGEREREQ